MPVIIDHDFSIIASTDPGELDENTIVSNDGARLDISREEPIYFSASSMVTTVEVSSASIWNTSPNISTARDNNIFVYLIGGVTQPQIIIPDGLYSISTLNAEISRAIVNAGNPSNTLSLSGNLSTGKVVITLDIGVQINFTQSTIRDVLGFTVGIKPAVAPVITGTSITGENQANFANTLNWIIKSNIFPSSIPINNQGQNILASIPITSGVGSITNYTPFNPTKSGTNEMRGKSVQNFYVEICDSAGVRLPQTESWSLTITMRQKILVSETKMPLLNVF